MNPPTKDTIPGLLLRSIPRLFAFAQKVQRDAEDPPLILADERLPGEVVALATAFEQGVLIQQALPPSIGRRRQAWDHAAC